MTSTAETLKRDAQTISSRWPTRVPWELGLLVVLVVGIYFTRLSALTIRGEESRRATVGMEMIETGDWIVPRQQGDPFFTSSRPPLQAWSMATIGLARGGVDAVAVRLPSVTALLLLVLLIYGYSRTFLSRAGAFVAAAAYATMGQVLELGRLGETDLMFTLLLAGSLLVWHWGHVRKWPAGWAWSAAYLLAALATLTKGPQAPVYFAASIGVFLLLVGRWRDAFSRAHLLGIGVFLAVLAAWQVPFYLKMGWPGVRHVYTGDVGLYLNDWHWLSVLKHLARFPVEVLLACLMPWSVLLVAYLSRRFRRAIGPARGHVLFLVCCIAVAFPTVWWLPGTRTRFLMPLYPYFAVLIGLAAQRCWEAAPEVAYRKTWSRYLSVVAVLMVAGGLVILGATLFGGTTSKLGQPWPFAVCYLLASIACATIALWSRDASTDLRRVAGALSIAAFWGLTWTGAIVNTQMRRSERAAEAVAQLKQQLPEDVRLVSIGPIHHLFAYHYARPIRLQPIPGRGEQPDAGVVYFCAMNDVPLNFPWEKVGAITCDRNRSSRPECQVIIGRRLADGAAGSDFRIADRRSKATLGKPNR